MAELLQRQHSLPVVRVRLVERDARPAVQVELVANVEGNQYVRGERVDALDRYGFGSDRSVEPAPEVPGEVNELAAAWVREEIDPEATGQPVLWLHLVKPYGLLGAVPWERGLQPACGIAVLRLPDVLPPAGRPTTTYDVALCVPEPDPRAFDVALALRAGVGGRAQIHVFAGHQARATLRAELPSEGFMHHDPRAPAQRRTTKPGTPRSRWLEWVRGTLPGRTVDAVHFVAQGHALGTDGALLLPPVGTDTVSYPEPVQAGELRAFLTDVGAIVAGFTAPSLNRSPFGLLKLVDELGALRAGPVLFHDPAAAASRHVLEEVYRLLSDPSPGRPPADPALVLFAQPQQIATTRPENAPEIRSEALRPSSAVEEHLRKPETPRWVAAAERYIAEQEADLIRFRQSIESQRPTSAQVAHYNGVSSALEKIRAVIDRHAQEQL